MVRCISPDHDAFWGLKRRKPSEREGRRGECPAGVVKRSRYGVVATGAETSFGW